MLLLCPDHPDWNHSFEVLARIDTAGASIAEVTCKRGVNPMAKIVGIDSGTTNSVVAVVQSGEPVVIPAAEGSNIVPFWGKA